MKRALRPSALLLVLAPILVANPEKSAAQHACYPEYWCWAGGASGDMLDFGPADCCSQAAPTFWHNDCRICTQGICHYECAPSEEDQDQDELFAYREAVEAFARMDVDGVLAQAHVVGPYLRWNADRGALQLLSSYHDQVLASLSASELPEWAIVAFQVLGGIHEAGAAVAFRDRSTRASLHTGNLVMPGSDAGRDPR
jgi:hypothetical protein